MKTSDFYYDLPPELIAQTPAQPRDSARMLVYDRSTGSTEDRIFRDFPDFLHPNDVLVINETRVIPARLIGTKDESGIPVEVLLLKRIDANSWETLVKPGRRLKEGVTVSFGGGKLHGTIGETTSAGGRIVTFTYQGVFEEILDELGEMQLPPYIHEHLDDPEQYQTVYARQGGRGGGAAPARAPLPPPL